MAEYSIATDFLLGLFVLVLIRMEISRQLHLEHITGGLVDLATKVTVLVQPQVIWF